MGNSFEKTCIPFNSSSCKWIFYCKKEKQKHFFSNSLWTCAFSLLSVLGRGLKIFMNDSKHTFPALCLAALCSPTVEVMEMLLHTWDHMNTLGLRWSKPSVAWLSQHGCNYSAKRLRSTRHLSPCGGIFIFTTTYTCMTEMSPLYWEEWKRNRPGWVSHPLTSFKG